MEIWFAPRDPKRHRFVVARTGADTIDVLLETRSLLLHDLAHYAHEVTAGTSDGFYGLLAAGCSLAQLRDPAGLPAEQLAKLMALEKTVALLQSAFKHGAVSCSADDARVLRGLWGAWSKTKQGEALYLRWPDPTPSVVSAPS